VDAQAGQRTSDGFQRPLSTELIEALCRRTFGDHARIAHVAEIGVGTYNSTYRVDIEGQGPVILRVAPDRAQQARGDRDAMRNEYAAAPYFAALSPLVPRILAADFTQQLISRDYMFQSLLAGAPASMALSAYRGSGLRSYYRQLGAITQLVHSVRGERFGRVAGPTFNTWSEALSEQFRTMAGDFEAAGVDSSDVRRVLGAVSAHRAALDNVAEPRLLHGDLWTLNIMIDPDAAEPTITGVLDFDGASWGDPMSDWTIHQVRQRSGTDVDAFWDTYGHHAMDSAGAVRELFYRARNIAGARLDIHRRGINLDEVPPIHWDLSDVLACF
jgi:aminoglycoside phosphotransferase (APT) family kinase protein